MRDIHKFIAIFLIVIGTLPFLGIGTGVLTQAVHLLTIISGVILLLTK